MKMKLLMFFLILVVACIVWGIIETKYIRVRTYEYQEPRLEGMKVAFISDFHYKNRWDDGKIKRAVRKINRESPDLIILGGDYTEDRADKLETVFHFLKDLEAPLGVYLVTGNHDYSPGMSMKLSTLMRKYGIQSLNNTSYWIDYQGERFKLGGIPDMRHEQVDLSATTNDVSEDDFVIFVSHQPDVVKELTDEERALIDLMISGHTHGGQMTIFGYAHYIPSKYGQQFRSGRIEMEPTTLIVSNGVGETRIPLRYFAPAEVVLIQFVGN